MQHPIQQNGENNFSGNSESIESVDGYMMVQPARTTSRVAIRRFEIRFFIHIMEYFNTAEKNAMLEEGYEFDQKLIYEKYASIISQTEV